jgi:hypothetical protein
MFLDHVRQIELLRKPPSHAFQHRDGLRPTPVQQLRTGHFQVHDPLRRQDLDVTAPLNERYDSEQTEELASSWTRGNLQVDGTETTL